MTQKNSNEKKAAISNETTANKKVRKHTKHGCHMKKKTSETFWNLLRISLGLTLADIEDYTGFKANRISNWFTGRSIPQDWEIEKLCDMMDIPYEKGKLEMKNARTVFLTQHGTVNKEPRKAPVYVKDDIEKIVNDKKEIIIKEDSKWDGSIYQVLEPIYRKVDFEDFMNIFKCLRYNIHVEDDIRKKFFEILDYETYEMLRNELP